MTQSKPAEELSNKILGFHQENYKKPETHQVISDPRASYFQYSRYYHILKEFDKLSFEGFLDVGCAEGMYLLAVKQKRPQCGIYGVDFSPAGLKKAKGYVGDLGFLACADATHLPFPDRSFDLILCSETLEHIVDDLSAFKELGRICRKTCIITVPSFNNMRAKTNFKPDYECKRDSHLRKYLQSDLEDILSVSFNKVTIFNVSSWYLSSADVITHMFLPKKIASMLSRFFSKFAALDYKLSKAGAHGHSFICICQNNPEPR